MYKRRSNALRADCDGELNIEFHEAGITALRVRFPAETHLQYAFVVRVLTHANLISV